MRPIGFKNSGPAPRRGITIIEVMIVVTVVTMLLAVCAVSIQLLMRLNADVQGRFNATVALDRLARQVRADSHASATAQIVGDEKNKARPAGLRLVFEADHTVTYQSADGGMVRTESRGGKVIRHETYALPRGNVGRFELRDESSRRLVVLVMARVANPNKPEPLRPLEIVALQGKDRAGPPRNQGNTPR
jgi:type II secretory pathway pseudopilin PulG